MVVLINRHLTCIDKLWPVQTQSSSVLTSVCLSLLSCHQPAAHRRAGRGDVRSRVCDSARVRGAYVAFWDIVRRLYCVCVCVCVCVYSKGNSILEVDDEGGRMFLRVLTHLTMHDYPPLVSGALQLLFRHFSQRQEVLHTFKQVHTHTHTHTHTRTQLR